ncbi:MAG: diguanylate cyclase [Rubrivivax sp.]
MTGLSAGTEGLWIAAAATAVAALALSVAGRRQPPSPRGWRLWQAALWLGSAGIALGAAGGPHPVALPLAQVLLLQWPILALVGLRRFHARIDWPGRERHDWLLLLASALLVALSAAWPVDSAVAAVGAPAGALLVHLYAASLLVCAAARPDDRPMHLLGAVIALAACAPMIATLPDIDPRSLFQAGAMATALASVAMAFIVLSLAFDRSQRHLRASRRRLRALASIDPLTQVPNRRRFEELAARAIIHDTPGSAVLVMFDVDHFKQINDRYGHAGGDRALRLVSRCLREVLRVNDVPSRHGGDEFALLLRHASVRDAMGVATRLVQRVQTAAADAALPPLSLSFGIVQVQPAEGLGQALERADQALYEAKRQGRSRAVAAGNGGGPHPVFTDSGPLGLMKAA